MVFCNSSQNAKHRILAPDKPNDKPPPLEREIPRKRISFFVQYRGTISDQLVQTFKKVADIDTFFTTRKLRTCLPSLKGPISTFMRSKVVYQMTCSRCQSTYVGQTIRHLTTRITEHEERINTTVAQHLSQCADSKGDCKILDSSGCK